MDGWRQVTRPVRVDRSGRNGPTRYAATTAAWRRTSRGFYVPSDVTPTPLQRVAEIGVLTAWDLAVTGWAALCWQGATWVTGTRADGTAWPVDLAANSARVRSRSGLRLCEERVDPRAFRLVDGLWVAEPVTAAAFAARHADTLEGAVELLDMACADDLVSLEEVATWLKRHPWAQGRSQALAALALADENVWSPRGVHARLAWHRASGVRPLANRPVFSPDGRHLGTPDLLDPETGVCGECDGDRHLERHQRARDLRREDGFRAHGLEPFVLVAGDLGKSGRLAERLAAAQERAARIPEERRLWRLDPPDHWRSTHTVGLRRALEGVDRDIWLPRR